MQDAVTLDSLAGDGEDTSAHDAPRHALRRLWSRLPMWEKAAIYGGFALLATTGIIALLMPAPPPKAVKIARAPTTITTPVTVQDKWEDLGTYMHRENVSTLKAAQPEDHSAEIEAARLEAIRAQLQSPGLPAPVAIVLPPKPEVKKVAAAPAAKKETSLVSNRAKETLALAEALKVAMRTVGLNEGKTGLSTYRE